MAAGTILAFTALSLCASLGGGRGGKGNPSNGLNTTLAGGLAGGGLGVIAATALSRNRTVRAGSAMSGDRADREGGSGGWKDWRPFRVVRKVRESEAITSFHLEPVDAGPLPGFRPGQFLPIRLAIPGQPHPLIRTYSLSDYPEAGPPSSYRLSVKREPAPQHLDVPAGLASNFLHDHVQEGSIIEARPPSGSFFLDLGRDIPVVLISNGIGITPMLAMLKATIRSTPGRRVWFFHGTRNGRSHAFRDEVAQLVRQQDQVKIHYAYSMPHPDDQMVYQSEGYIDASLIGSMVGEDADYFICGSPPFLDSIRSGLINQGIGSDRIRFEMFSKPQPPSPSAASMSPGSTPAGAGAVAGSGEVMVTFARSNRTIPWRDDAANLLAFAEANGLNPDYSCRAGICGTCECRLLAGAVSYEVEPGAAVAPGSVLICIARPASDRVSLDL